MEVLDLLLLKPPKSKKLKPGSVKKPTSLRRQSLMPSKKRFKPPVSALKKRKNRSRLRGMIKTIGLKVEPEATYLPEVLNRNPPSLDNTIWI